MYLFYVYAKFGRRSFFHLFWALGFIFSGIGVLSRLNFQVDLFLLGVLFTASFTMFFVGISFLFPKFKGVLLFTVATVCLILLETYLLYPGLVFAVAPIPYTVVLLGIVLVMRKYGKFLYSLFFGWIILTVVDLATFSGFLSLYYAYMLTVPAKVLVLYGAINPMFGMVGVEMQKWLWRTAQLPPVKRSHFTLIKCVKTPYTREISWIKQRIVDNIKNGIKTFLVVLYDLISVDMLKDLEFLEHRDVHVIRILRETEEPRLKEEYDIFDKEKILVVKDDLTSFARLISRIVRYSQEKGLTCNIIFYSFSWLIHTHGWRNIYLLLTYKIPEIKNSNVYLHALYYPEIHEEKVTVNIFEKLAEEIITI